MSQSLLSDRGTSHQGHVPDPPKHLRRGTLLIRNFWHLLVRKTKKNKKVSNLDDEWKKPRGDLKSKASLVKSRTFTAGLMAGCPFLRPHYPPTPMHLQKGQGNQREICAPWHGTLPSSSTLPRSKTKLWSQAAVFSLLPVLCHSFLLGGGVRPRSAWADSFAKACMSVITRRPKYTHYSDVWRNGLHMLSCPIWLLMEGNGRRKKI